MDVETWVDTVDAFHTVTLDDSREYVAVTYHTGAEAEADLVPTPIFRTMARPALERADRPRYINTHALKEAAEGYGYKEAVERWVQHECIPDYHPAEKPWDRAMRYAEYCEPSNRNY